jgi:uncharacterized protein
MPLETPITVSERGSLPVDLLQPIRLADRPRFAGMPLDDFSPHVYSFTNLMIWQGKYHYRWGLADGQVVVHNRTLDCLCLGGMMAISPSRLAAWYDRYYLVPPEYPRRHPGLDRYFTSAPYPREQQDYLYDLDRLARLDQLGPPRLRSYLRQFRRRHPDHELRALTPADRESCECLFRQWVAGKQAARPMPDPAPVNKERAAFTAAWDHFDALGMEGLGLFVNRHLAGFFLYDALTPRTLVCHFVKSDYAVRSAGTAILWLAAQALRGRFRYMNFEQDLGLPGLRRQKETLQPMAITGFLHLVRK